MGRAFYKRYCSQNVYESGYKIPQGAQDKGCGRSGAYTSELSELCGEEKTRRIFRGSVILLLCLIAIFAIEIYPETITGVHSASFSVQKNSSAVDIAHILKNKRLIIDPFGFTAILRIEGAEGKLKSGNYVLKNLNNVFDIINALEKGVPQVEVKVTIPEGFTVSDIANRLYENGVIFDKKAFVKKALPFEGYLFPDTYFFIKGESADKIIQTMKRRFYAVLPKDFSEKAKEKGLSEKEAVILASIVEKEAKFDKDKPLVASVFLNRLKVGMPLQSDATINYLLKEKKLWLSQKDLEINSPYNTYKYKGLPPTPICNPGLKSLLAVVNAPETDFYYFLATPNGKTIFERTLEEHNRDIAKYYGG